jgi:hypothetical protein
MAGATALAHGAYRASAGECVTKGYGAGDATADNAWAGSPGAQPPPIP